MFDLIKEIIEPPYKALDLYSIFIAVFIMLFIPLTVIEATQASDNRTNAANLSIQKNNLDIRVKINSPKNNALVQGSVDVTISASDDNDTISAINLYLGNQLLAIVKNPSTANQFMAKVSWDTTKITNGKKTLSAIAFNSTSEQNFSDALPVYVSNTDITPPSISFSNISDGDYLSGNSFLVKLDANDENGVSLVEVSLDNKVIKTFTKVPYETNVDLSNLAPGNHTFSARAVDYAGNENKTSIVFYRGVKNLKD